MHQEDRRGKDVIVREEDENLGKEVNGFAVHATVARASVEKAGMIGESKVPVAEENGNFNKEVNGSKISLAEDDGLDLKEVPTDGNTKIMAPGKHDQQGSNEASSEVGQETNYSARNSVVGIRIGSAQDQSQAVCVNERNKKPDFKDGKLALNKELAREPKKRFSEIQKDSCVIDIKCGSGKSIGEDEESVCRICHLGSGQSAGAAGSDTSITTSGDLIHLGCVCKDELGIAHSQCAETWFKLKGNRLCEVCGETAKNVAGVGDGRFVEEWNEMRLTGIRRNPSGTVDRWWRGKPFCNILMACLPTVVPGIRISGFKTYYGGSYAPTLQPNKKRLAAIMAENSSAAWSSFEDRIQKMIEESQRVRLRGYDRSIY